MSDDFVSPKRKRRRCRDLRSGLSVAKELAEAHDHWAAFDLCRKLLEQADPDATGIAETTLFAANEALLCGEIEQAVRWAESQRENLDHQAEARLCLGRALAETSTPDTALSHLEYVTASGSEAHQEIMPKRNASHLRVVLDALGELQPSGETGLVDALHAAAEKVRQRALMVVVSDLFVDPKELGEAFQNRSFRWLFAGVLVIFLMVGVDQALNLYMYQYFWELNGGQILLMNVINPIG